MSSFVNGSIQLGSRSIDPAPQVRSPMERLSVRRAREMRQNPTPGEQALWALIRQRALGVLFRRQVPLWGFIADFYCWEEKLAIEVEPTAARPDAVRDAALAARGIVVLHLATEQVVDNPAEVFALIKRTLDSLREPPGASGSGLLSSTCTRARGVIKDTVSRGIYINTTVYGDAVVKDTVLLRSKTQRFRNLKDRDLRSFEGLRRLFIWAVRDGLLSHGEKSWRDFVSLAAKALRVGKMPARLFASLIRGKRFDWIAGRDEDAGKLLLRSWGPDAQAFDGRVT